MIAHRFYHEFRPRSGPAPSGKERQRICRECEAPERDLVHHPLAQLARDARAATGRTQRAFSELIGAAQPSIARWETGAAKPCRATISLLRLVLADPGLALRVLGGAR